ncbi:MAG TPA: hydantoinase/oxoprolinase family protein [Methylomirabilota bacterium]|nr:hydantoinase/oxoprolinase family protein [Methylomirabilota bacterium]
MKLGFDTGGTFTDFALLDDAGRLHVHKVLSTPADPALAVLKGVDELLARAGAARREAIRLFGATTVVTNAVLERKGARVAFLVTRGFRDLLRIRTEARYDLYDLGIRYPEPLVPRDLCFDVTERVAVDGRVVTPLDEAEVRAIARTLRERGVETVAVCFLHAPGFPAHEQRVAAILAEEAPALAVSLSSVVAPEVREYPRACTTVVNAYTAPMMRHHVAYLADELRGRGLDGRVFLMTSSGGLVPADAAAATPVRIIESGPAAGVIAAAEYGRQAGAPDVLSFDMGGTTAKLTLVPGGRPSVASELEVAHLERFKRGSGFPLKIHSIQTFEIGAGGGSIAARDALGLLRVGPRSAGADPGPVCYGVGGSEPTVTDADLLLGYLDAEAFLGGDFRLQREAAAAAIARLAGALGVTPERCAWGIHDLVNENMAKAASAHAAESGADLRRFTLVAFGGAGPVHAYGLARKLGITTVICPVGAGVMSAFGLLLAPVAADLAVSRPMRLGAWDHAALRSIVERLTAEGCALVIAAGVAAGDVSVSFAADMRHVGQGHEIAVTLPDPSLPAEAFRARLTAAFSAAYETLYGRGLLEGADLEVITWRARAAGPGEPFEARLAAQASVPGAARVSRRAWFEEAGGFVGTPVLSHYALAPGATVAGPAIVEQRESTVVVGPSATATVDAHHNLVLRLA